MPKSIREIGAAGIALYNQITADEEMTIREGLLIIHSLLCYYVRMQSEDHEDAQDMIDWLHHHATEFTARHTFGKGGKNVH